MYEFNGMCFCRVAVLIAVMIWRVMHSSANARNEESLSARKSRMALYRPIMPSWMMSSRSAPIRKYAFALTRTKLRYLLMRYSLAWSSPDFAVATSSSSAISGYVGASRLASATLRLRGTRFDDHYMSVATVRQGKGVKLL